MCLNIHTQPLACGKLAFNRNHRRGTIKVSLGDQGIRHLMLWACPSLFSSNNQIRLDSDRFDVSKSCLSRNSKSSYTFIYVYCSILLHYERCWSIVVNISVIYKESNTFFRWPAACQSVNQFQHRSFFLIGCAWGYCYICDTLHLLIPNCLRLEWQTVKLPTWFEQVSIG